MGLMGSLFGGAIGMALGGPLGAIAGAALGHTLGERGGRPAGRNEQAQAAFFISTFSMLAKMARADGRVTQPEIDAVTEFMRRDLALDPESERIAVRIFRQAKDSPIPFEEFAGQFHAIFQRDRQMLESMLELLSRVAMADGRLDEAERRLLDRAGQMWGLSAAEQAHIHRSHEPVPGRAYAVLGVEPDASMAEVKSRYRKLVTEYHPDKIIAKGLPEEFVELAEKRFQEIQAAYESIQAERATR